MTTEESSNPLKAFSWPLAGRAAICAVLAIVVLLQAAPEIMGGFTGVGAHGLLIALLLFGMALADGMYAFRFGIKLPARSLDVHGIGTTYSVREVEALMVAGSNPNEKYLSWIGRWAARASDRFSLLPVPYQRLAEVALTAIAFGIVSIAIIALLAAFGQAGGRAEAAAAVQSWLFAVLTVATYGYWTAMLGNVFTAAKWGRILSAGRIVKMLGMLLVLVVVVSFASQIAGASVPAAPSLQPWSFIAALGSAVIIAVILALAWLRSASDHFEMSCSRIQMSDSAAVHPQSIINALRSFIAQSKGGVYSEFGDKTARLTEQRSMPGGTFEGVVVGEYGARMQHVGAPPLIKLVATILGITSIGIGAVGCIFLWLAAGDPSWGYWMGFLAASLFGSLGLLIANYPLSETLWESYLIGVRVQGNYQSRGAMMLAEGGQNPGYGSILVDYTLDGGVSKAYSVSYLPAAMVKANAERILVQTTPDSSEREAVLRIIRGHLERAAGGG